MQEIHPSVWVAESAELYGKIHVGRESSLWPKCVLRAEVHELWIGCHTNIQDFAMLHVGYDHPVRVGDYCSITHHATLHGCSVEDDCLIGIGAVVMDGAVIGRGSIVAAGAVVTEGAVIPPHSIVAGVPGKRIRERDASFENRQNARFYCRNARAYAEGAHRSWAEPDFKALRQRRGESAAD